MSSAFDTFLQELKQGVSPRRGSYSYELLDKMEGSEQETVLSKLMRLAGERDPAAVTTLGELRYAPAVEIVREIASGGRCSLEARRALHLLGYGNEILGYLRSDLESPSMITRFSAVDLLGESSEDESTALLLGALSDTDARVRLLAYKKVIERFRLQPFQMAEGESYQDVRSPLKRLSYQLGRDLPSVYGEAATEIRNIAQGLQSGRTPQDLSLVFDGGNAAFVQTLFSFRKKGSAELLQQHILSGSSHEVDYGKSFLCALLEAGDVRAPQLLVNLDVSSRRTFFQEAKDANLGDAAFQEELARVMGSESD